MKTKNLITTLVVIGLSGCATVAPPQLVEAREAYAKSSIGLASTLTPTELYDAKKVLDKANQEFEQNGDTLEVRDYSYIALRKVQLSDVKARTEMYRQKVTEATNAGVHVRDTQVTEAQASLASTREQLQAERRDNTEATSGLRAENRAQGKELEKTNAQLDAEKLARLSAEAKLAGAMKDLATIAAVREEARGVVITLSGSVLFATGTYTLLNTAKTKLDQVAEALLAQADDRRMIIEGHTDSQGSDAINQPLSLNRANAVREYLLSRGVAPEKVTAVGMGSTRPIVDNKNAENRANNRRVEIVIGGSRVTTR